MSRAQNSAWDIASVQYMLVTVTALLAFRTVACTGSCSRDPFPKCQVLSLTYNWHNGSLGPDPGLHPSCHHTIRKGTLLCTPPYPCIDTMVPNAAEHTKQETKGMRGRPQGFSFCRKMVAHSFFHSFICSTNTYRAPPF